MSGRDYSNNAAIAEACGVDGDLAEDMAATLHRAVTVALTEYCIGMQREGISVVSTLSAVLQVSASMLQGIAPGADVDQTLRNLAEVADLVARGEKQTPPDLKQRLIDNGIAVTLAARRARKGKEALS